MVLVSVLLRRKRKREERNGISIDHLHKFNQRNISAWNMKKLMSIVKQGVFSTVDDKIQDSTDEVTVHITTKNQAKAVARNVFFNVVNPHFECVSYTKLINQFNEYETHLDSRLTTYIKPFLQQP